MTSSIAEVPNSNAAGKSKPSDNLEKEAVGLDVPVRIHGSQVTAVVLDATEHAEPFEEDTSTMIVFPRGAVVKLRACVRVGHAVVLTNLQTKQTALCRIIQVSSTTGTAHYVKLEFNLPMHAFWGVHFPSDGQGEPSVAHTQIPHAAQEIQVSSEDSKTFEPAAEELADSATPPSSKLLPVAVQQESNAPEAPATFARPAPSYGVSENTHRELVPLAAAPTKAAPPVKMPLAVAATKPASRMAIASAPASESAIFDSLSTDEDVFGGEPSEAAKRGAEKRAFPAPMRSLDHPSLLFKDAPKKRSRVAVLTGVAAAILISVGGWYALKHRVTVASAVNTNTPAAGVVAHPSPTPSAPVESIQTAPADAVSPSTSPAKSAAPIVADSNPQPAGSTITVTPVHENPPVASGSNVVDASQPPTIYAAKGNLTARPRMSKSKNLHVAAPVPKINAGVPDSIVGNPDTAGLSSLVGGSSGLPAPPASSATVSGGKIVAPRLIHSVPVNYPAMANTSHVEGDVQVEAEIGPTGKVTSAKAISGPVLLRDAAVNAVRQWRYSPATLDGKPISMQYMVMVRFRLGN